MRIKALLHRLLAVLALAATGATLPGPAAAVELIMLESPGCAWCQRWNREIAPIYPLTEEGKRAPLRRVDVTQPWPEDLDAVSRDRFTPTFIVVDNGSEVGRLRGYPGDDFFWPLLAEILAKLPPQTEMESEADENG